jgi:hypothetical protein
MAPVTEAQAQSRFIQAQKIVQEEANEFSRLAKGLEFQTPFNKPIQNFSEQELANIQNSGISLARTSLNSLNNRIGQSLDLIADMGNTLKRAQKAIKEGDFEGANNILGDIDSNVKFENERGINLKNPSSLINTSEFKQKYDFLRYQIQSRVQGNSNVTTDGHGDIVAGKANGDNAVQHAINADKMLDLAYEPFKNLRSGSEEQAIALLKKVKLLGVAESYLNSPTR